MNDQQRIRAAVNGDVAAFNELVRTYQGMAYRVAFRMLGDSEAAADATQEAFISAHRHLADLRGEFKPWLLRIVVNSCYDELRRRKRQPALSLATSGAGEDGLTLADLPSRDESPFEHAARREVAALVERGLGTLPAEMRLTMILVDIEGHSYIETAQIMETNIGTVKSRVARARGMMREYLEKHDVFAQHRQPRKVVSFPVTLLAFAGMLFAGLMAALA